MERKLGNAVRGHRFDLGLSRYRQDDAS
jgi:hypothetical protein